LFFVSAKVPGLYFRVLLFEEGSCRAEIAERLAQFVVTDIPKRRPVR
jgi:hypothetical protein